MKRIMTIMLIVAAMLGVQASYSTAMGKSKKTKEEKRLEKLEALRAQEAAEESKWKNSIKEVGNIYIYGIALSPVDSVVYITDELILEKAQMNKKNKFLIGRNELSAQLRSHLNERGITNRTCCVTFNRDLKKLDKAFIKQKEYFKKRGFLVKVVDQTEFRFRTIRTEE